MPEPFPLSQCQTISSLDFETMDLSRHIMEPKIDGWRIQFHVIPDERCYAWTRTAHDATGKMPWIERQLLKFGTEVRLDGEVVWMDDGWEPDYNYTARCLGSGTDICVMKQQERGGGGLVYFVYDILAVESVDLRQQPLAKRKLALKSHLGEVDHVRMIMGHEPSTERHVKNFEQFLEGSVLKDLRSPYAGRRYKSWLKLKEQETVTVKIIGYKPGQGKYQGLIGAIMWKDQSTGVEGFCSGMTDDDRVWISDHAQALIGTWIEIKHYGKLVDGYRHPQFMRFRDDLNA